MATLSVGLNPNLTDMIHFNFVSGGSVVGSYWKTGLGSALGFTNGVQITTVPNINNGISHKLELIINGNVVLSLVDNAVVAIHKDDVISTIAGNWFFAQIHGAGEKIYGVEAYGATDNTENQRELLKVKQINSDFVTTNAISIGTDSPNGSFSVYDNCSDVNNVPTITGKLSAKLRIKSATSGYTSRLELYNGAGGYGYMEFNGGYDLTLHGNDGAAFLTKPFNATPYFSAALKIGGSSGVTITTGNGSPEGSVTAIVGSLYTNKTGGANTTLYIKESGTGNTGWIAK